MRGVSPPLNSFLKLRALNTNEGYEAGVEDLTCLGPMARRILRWWMSSDVPEGAPTGPRGTRRGAPPGTRGGAPPGPRGRAQRTGPSRAHGRDPGEGSTKTRGKAPRRPMRLHHQSPGESLTRDGSWAWKVPVAPEGVLGGPMEGSWGVLKGLGGSWCGSWGSSGRPWGGTWRLHGPQDYFGVHGPT